ncbi:MAG: extracellular solute-binding protein [Treponema sp.]|nr:extracellular solute-binding protein [Treponema sp.]
MAQIRINKTLRNFIIGVAVIVLIFVVSSLIPEKSFEKKYRNLDDSAAQGAVSMYKTYSEYLSEHSNAKNPNVTVDLNVFDYDAEKSSYVYEKKDYYGKDVLVTEDRSDVSWTFDVPEEGFYNIKMEYICIPSRSITMERILKINGEIPFSGADILAFYRLWKDASEPAYDNRGNVIRPSQAEFYDYQTVYYKSDLGYEVEPYRFYFKQGENTISLTSTNEPMAISSISLVPVRKAATYEAYVSNQPSKPESYAGKNVRVKVQGESAPRRSDQSLFARYDRSSAITEPNNVKNTILNFIGGDAWKNPGQWIEWDVDIPEDGWYTVSVKARQFYQRGSISFRSLYIDGEIPFDALESIPFYYSSDWKTITLADKDNNPYKFYFSKGKHSFRLEATLGEIGSVISRLQDSVFRLSQIYRTILVLTGNNPDQYRDYNIDTVFSAEYEQMNLESKRLYKMLDELIKITGEKSDKIASIETLAIQLEQFYKRPDKITQAFQRFRDNITSVSSSILTLTESKLDIDYILVQGANDKIKKDKTNFVKNIVHEAKSFMASYFSDSSSLGNVYKKGEKHLIDVWIVAGRDQSQILKNMIDDTFTAKTGIGVNLKVIIADALLNAVVAGKGPDVVVTIDVSKPVNYAMRHANVDLMQFPDCKDVLKQFTPSAYEAFSYNGGVYALPETETFNLLFYRKDILDQIGIKVPQTWDELIDVLPTIQGNNLSVGIPFPVIQMPDMTTLYSMVCQNGGRIYTPSGTKSSLDSEAGINAFEFYTDLYVDYGLPPNFDALGRFRTGEMPILINSYATYNSIVVGAPEIRGLWDFTYLPGTKRVDENGNEYIDKTAIGTGAGCMMIDNHDETKKLDSWEFMKWWVSTETQVRFGRELESVLGPSARYQTANREALRLLSWNSRQLELLENALDRTRGIPEVPGSYYTGRHIANAIRNVVYMNEDPREILIEYTRKINEELKRKRQEFNLPLED